MLVKPPSSSFLGWIIGEFFIYSGGIKQLPVFLLKLSEEGHELLNCSSYRMNGNSSFTIWGLPSFACSGRTEHYFYEHQLCVRMKVLGSSLFLSNFALNAAFLS